MHAESLLCPACRRIRDRLPAGTLTLRGPYCRTHRAELLAKVRDTVTEQSAVYPLRRLMAVVERPDAVEVLFTDGHLPVIVAEALRQSFAGELEFDPSEPTGVVNVSWVH